MITVEGSDTLKIGEIRSNPTRAIAIDGLLFSGWQDHLDSFSRASLITPPSVAIIASRCFSLLATPRPFSIFFGSMRDAPVWQSLRIA